MSNVFRKKTLFFIVLPLVFAGGCRFLPDGDVPDSLVNPGKHKMEIPRDQEAIMVTAIEMFAVTHGFVNRKPAIQVPDISKTFRSKLKDSGILPVDDGVCYDYRMVIENGLLQLRDRSGKKVFEKKFDIQN